MRLKMDTIRNFFLLAIYIFPKRGDDEVKLSGQLKFPLTAKS
jgi:hypothetical protein